MKIELDNNIYNVIIERKRSTRNTYIRIHDNLDIYVTCNILTTDHYIIDLINTKERQVLRMLEKVKRKKTKEEAFYYLGKKYDIIYINRKGLTFGDDKVFVENSFSFDSWYKKEALKVFQNELEKMYQSFIYQIPFPSLSIRKMKTRWGVCNVKTHRITLNLELIKKDLKYLDYVIVHELSHLLYANHGKDFCQCVENNFKDYKKIRKELKEDE